MSETDLAWKSREQREAEGKSEIRGRESEDELRERTAMGLAECISQSRGDTCTYISFSVESFTKW